MRIMKAKERSFAYGGTVNSVFISAGSVKAIALAGIMASPRIGSTAFAPAASFI